MPAHRPLPFALPSGVLGALLIILSTLVGCFPPAETGSIAQFTGVVADDFQCRTSDDNTVAAMPGMLATFTQEGPDTSSVVVAFQGHWSQFAAGDTTVGAFIFLEIDGNRADVTSTNGGVLVTPGPTSVVGSGTHGFNFVTEPVLPGPHTATILWADNVLNGSGTICISERSMVIHHR